jgi:putative FmdB family regulatory protein
MQMPTYTYQCQKCEHEMDVFHSMTENPKVKCEACGSRRTKRLLGTGAGIIFKGSGFYETDYKNGRSKGKSKEESSKKSDSEAKSETASKSEAGAKSDSGGKKKPDGTKAA